MFTITLVRKVTADAVGSLVMQMNTSNLPHDKLCLPFKHILKYSNPSPRVGLQNVDSNIHDLPFVSSFANCGVCVYVAMFSLLSSKKN
jgi:hypothetical protein